MSLVKIQGNASGTGEFTIVAPNSNTNRTLTLPDNTGTILTTGGTISASQLPAGSVLQVVQTSKNDTFSSSSSTWTDITGMSLSITPASASNKILILVAINMTGNSDAGIRLLRSSTVIGAGTGASNQNVMYMTNTGGVSGNNFGFYLGGSPCLDSPATTSAITYKIQMYANESYTAYVNRRINDSNFIGFSSITAMEIAA
jgi:hypothetical protein